MAEYNVATPLHMEYAGVSYRMQRCILCVLWYDDCQGCPHQEAHSCDGYGLEGPAFVCG